MKFLRNPFRNFRKPQPLRKAGRSRPSVEALDDRIVPYAGKGLEFNITPTAAVPQQLLAAFKVAADQWSTILTDDIIVNVTIDYSASAPGLGQASSANTIKSLTEIRNALTADQRSVSDVSAVAHLPAGDSAKIYTTNYNTGAAMFDANGTDNNTYFNFTRANAKAMGLRAANDPGLDGIITFRSINNFDYDRSDGIGAGKYDFVGTAMHEIGHMLGFLSGAETVDFRSKPNGTQYNPANNQDNQIVLKPQDLFRFSAASIAAGADLDLRADLASKFFSIDGGATPLAKFSTGTNNGDHNETHHWKDNLGLGVMDPSIAPAEFGDVTALDVQLLDVIGWDVRMDYGDAPDTGNGTSAGNYRTTLADNGPRHMLFAPTGLIADPVGAPKVYLGAGVGVDSNGKPTANASGDNDDAIAVMPTFVAGTTLNLSIASSATAAKPAILNYFVDFNQNGVFNDAGESFTTVLSSPTQLIQIAVPTGATVGNTFARFRISAAGGLGPNGPAADGEVEDYDVEVVAPHKPIVSDLALLEDTLSAPIPIVVAAANEGITSFKISGIAGGLLFKSDGVTPIVNGSFLTLADGLAGVRFLPTPNSNATGHFDVESSQDGIAVSSDKATSTITIIPVGDTPQVANATTIESKLSAPIVITRNALDGAEVTSFRISGITGGVLYKSDGVTIVQNGDFITAADALAGVRFLPNFNSLIAGHFDVESSQDGSTVAAQSGKSNCTILVTAPTKLLIAGVLGGSQLLMSVDMNSGIFSGGGTYTAPNGQSYVVTVKSGTRNGSSARIQGIIGLPGNSTGIAFTLDVDAVTGGIQLSYKGSKGAMVKLTTIGAVMFQ
jgi:hypothetical protein